METISPKKKTCSVTSVDSDTRFETTPNQGHEEEIVELGDDVLTEIILRLPLDSVARSKCVSKHWSAAVSDDYLRRRLPFHISMLCFPDNDDDSNGGKPVFYACAGGGSTLDPLDDLGSFFPWHESSVICDGSNGLLLCRSPDSSLFVISPVTKRFAALPKPAKSAVLSVLAFDPLSSSSPSTYHVVNFTGWRDRGAAVEVYSSETRAWTAHEAGFGAVPSAALSGTMHCHGGRLFVLASGPGLGSGPGCLVCIDLAPAQAELACAIIALPESVASDGRLASSGGRLHYVCGGEDGCLKVWALEDEGAGKQWRLKHAARVVAVAGDEGDVVGEEVRFLAMHPEKEAVVYLWTPWKVVEYDLGKRELTGAAWELGSKRRSRPVKTWLVPASCYLSDVLLG
ncbi:uncharacterized protein LOC100834517 [Brachypodium distachyon]|uniref:F-box domain-containing protein n=1 Tax=Brachypodium distachyon TaxID=15368 RepID=I1I8V5_BRADI|nr:uncharacterized protein LOC100834517 [Brachypodium distachyon]KQJ99102.1 hypothetical protein BRADI_3g41110v3 [Brachypodium distachyon]|eukprot:XP_003572435.1 uncharacterized protein LOC100834517 [Brachypodium distachyon]